MLPLLLLPPGFQDASCDRDRVSAAAGFLAWRADAIRASGLLDTTSRGYLFAIQNKYRVMQRGLSAVEVPTSSAVT